MQPYHQKNQSVKRADKPDSVHRRSSCESRWRDRHYSGPGVATTARCYLPASSAEPHQRWPTWYCCAQRLPVSPGARPAPRVAMGFSGLRRQPSGLRQPGQLALAPIEHLRWRVTPRLVSVALILTSRWAAVSCCAVLCSPDVPPVPGFPYGTSGGLACFTERIIAQMHWRFPGPAQAHGVRASGRANSG